MAGNNLNTNNNPYVGPRTFTEKDAPLFFGREREARELLSLVISEPLTLFYARSGAGKSSLINARLIPGLRQEEFVVLPVTRVSGALPAGVKEVANIFVFNLLLNLDQNKHDPRMLAQQSLSDYLSQSKALLTDASLARVLIVDQFEEVFTTHLDRWQERRGFFEQLAQALKQDPLLWVVLSLREDHVASLDPFARLLPGRLRPRLFMQRMDADTALAAITEPAGQEGRPFGPDVAENLVKNLRQIRGQTASDVVYGEFVEPVQLQVVCYQLWEKLQTRPQGEITQDDVDELGNVDEALGQFYEQAIAKVMLETHVTEQALRNWFEHELITEAHTRGTVYQGKDTTAGLPNEALRLLVNQFLLRSEFRAGGTWYELVHDRFVEPILLANVAWRLRQSPLVQSAEAWDRAGRPKEMLYRGGQLREMLQQTNPETADEPVKSFLQISQAAQTERDLLQAQEKAAEERRRAEQEARVSSRLRNLAVTLIVVFLIAAAAAVWALLERNQASMQAEANATLAIENAAAASTAQVANETSVYFAVEANNLAGTSFASQAEAENAAATSEAARATSDALAIENSNLATTSEANAIIAATRAAEAILAQQEAEKQECVISAQALASQAILTLTQPENNTELATLLAVQAGSLSCAGTTAAEGLTTLTETVLRDVLTRPYYNNILRAAGSTVRDLAFSGDGRWLAAANDSDRVLVYDLLFPGSTPLQLSGFTGYIRAVAFNTQTGQFAAAGDDTLIYLWDLTTPETPILTLTGHTAAVRALTFSPDGRTLISGGDDRTLRAWDLTSEDPNKTAIVRAEHANAIFTILYAQGSSRLFIISTSSEAVYLWDTSRLAQTSPLRLSSFQRFINGMAISRTGRLLATIGSDSAVRLWDITNTANIPAPTSLTLDVAQIGAVAFSPINNTLFVGDTTGVIRLWDLPRYTQSPGLAFATLTGPQSPVLALTVDPTGTILASATAGGEIRLWQLQATDFADIAPDYATLLAQACAAVDRNLTPTEWANYLPGQAYQITCPDLPANVAE
ncbi:MAG: WD40 repeat domain-containing protein [Chloroflexi bacterium]|nr:WD40 repeat domain-containing protein [Chloroflexota bacterium]MBP8056425.1 WD40 repeat domain-containing protein [Chloroflexota bacterium]